MAITNDLDKVYWLFAEALMPGDTYYDILSRVHEAVKPESYVEIGVAAGASLALARPDTAAVAIDPQPRIANRICSRATLYPVTTDEFFTSRDLMKELGTSRLAMAFIDGLHHFEQTLRDFENVERYADADTVVFMHDPLPITRRVAARTATTDFWCGDVWKVVPCLLKYRPDLKMSIIPTYPSGLVVITRLDPRSTVLRERSAEILAEHMDRELEYETLSPERIRATPGLISNDWDAIRRALRA